MNEECVVGVFDSLQKAEQAVWILRRADFPATQISLVTSELKDKPQLLEQLKMGDDSVRDAAIGAGLGSILAVLAGIGITVATGGGIVVLLAGPIGGIGVSAVVGAFLGGLLGWGVHKEHVEHYEQCVRDGKVLVIVDGGPLELAHADRILKETDVAEVRLHARTASEAPEVLGQ